MTPFFLANNLAEIVFHFCHNFLQIATVVKMLRLSLKF